MALSPDGSGSQEGPRGPRRYRDYKEPKPGKYPYRPEPLDAKPITPPEFSGVLLAASAFEMCGLHPLNVVAVRQQVLARPPAVPAGVFKSMANIVRETGLLGLYRGLGFTLLGRIPLSIVRAVSVGSIKELFGVVTHEDASPPPMTPLFAFMTFLAGATAGVVDTSVLALVDAKTYPSMANIPPPRESLMQRYIRGLGPTALRQAVLTGTTFTVYAVAIDQLTVENFEMNGGKSLAAGASASVIGAVVSSPLDVWRAHLLAGVEEPFSARLAREGPGLFMRGLWARTMSLSLGAALMLIGTETTMRALRTVRD